jgi:hypothetical protein
MSTPTMFRIPDFALGALITAIITTFAIFAAFSDFGNLVCWMPLTGGVLIAAVAVFAGIGSNSERLNVALVLASAVTGLLIAMQLFEMRRMYKPIADQAQTLRTQIEEMKLEQRAWVSITSISISDARKDINGLSPTFRYSVENSGRNPASNVNFNAKLYLMPGTGTTVGNFAVENHLCQPPGVANNSLGFAVFPGQKTPDYQIGFTFSQADIDNYEAKLGKKIGSFPIAVLACLGYMDAVSQTWHGTPAAFQVIRVSETSFGGVPFDTEALSTAHLFIQAFPSDVAPPF